MANATIKCLITANAYIYKDKSGNYYSTGIYDRSFLLRYLSVFEEILFTAKIKTYEENEDLQLEPLDCENIKIIELPYFRGMRGLFCNVLTVWQQIGKAIKLADCYIFRVTQLESIIGFMRRNKKLPYAMEVVNDAMLGNRARWIQYILLVIYKRMIKGACGVAYVTRKILQNKYPYTPKDGVVTNYSSIDLSDNSIREPKCFNNKKYIQRESILRIIHVSNTITGNDKGHYTLLSIVEQLCNAGIKAECTFVGDGAEIQQLKENANKKGILNKVHFVGRKNNKNELLNYMSQFDLFIFPTHLPEGLPRVLIEACAVGLPCLSSNEGGCVELLPKEFLFDKDDIDGFVNKTMELVNDTKKLERMSRQNINTAKRYTQSLLNKKRSAFYAHLRKKTENNLEERI